MIAVIEVFLKPHRQTLFAAVRIMPFHPDGMRIQPAGFNLTSGKFAKICSHPHRCTVQIRRFRITNLQRDTKLSRTRLKFSDVIQHNILLLIIFIIIFSEK